MGPRQAHAREKGIGPYAQSGERLAAAGLALARSLARSAPSAWTVVVGRGTAAEMGERESADAWCRALVTERARGRAYGRESRRRLGAGGAQGSIMWVGADRGAVVSTGAPGESCGIGTSGIRTNDVKGIDVRRI